MKKFLEFLVRAIVDSPAEVTIDESQDGGITTFRIKVAQNDMGKIIGRDGGIIKSVRNLVRAAAVKEGKRVNVEILESSQGGLEK